MHIQDLPIGAKYTTTEAASNHIASYKLSGTGAAPVIVSGAKANQAQNAQLACSEETVEKSGELFFTRLYGETSCMFE